MSRTVFLLLVLLGRRVLSRSASAAILPSALFCERFSLGASWAFSFQQVLLPDNRSQFPYLRTEVGPDLARSHLNSAVPLSDSNPALRHRAYDGAVVAQWFVDLTVHPQLVKQDRQLPSYGNDRSFLGIASSSLGEFQSPSPQITVLPKRS